MIILLKIIAKFNLRLVIFCFIILFISCDTAKNDINYWDKKADASLAKGDYDKAESCYKEKLKIAEFMGWTDTKASTLVSILEMKTFKKTYTVEDIENDYKNAFLFCETTKECSKVTVYKIYSSRLSFLLFNKKDVIEAKTIFSEIMNDNNKLLTKSEKIEVLVDLTEYLDIAGLKSEEESMLKEIKEWQRQKL
jgi:tetratricopeptide (TPR) repeat protein